MSSPIPRGRWAALAATAVLAGLLAPVGAAFDPPAAAAELSELSVEATPLASGLQRPTAIAAPDDGSDRLLITEKPGRVRVYHPDSGLASGALLDITDRVGSGGNEQGLLGIATAADFAQSPVLYVAYTATGSGELTLARFPLDNAGQDPVDPGREEVLLTQEHPDFNNHNGGQLAFDSAGLLYWSLGDGGGAGDPYDAGQDPSTLLGTIVRLDVSAACGGLPYCVPADNPFVGDPQGRDEVWAYGLRNAWRFSVDPADDSLWIGDVGQGGSEEVNHIPAGTGGANFGWSCMEGSVVFDQQQCVPGADLVDPVFTYPTAGGNCAVIGGHVYRGQQYADVAGGIYVVSDYCSGNTWGIQADGSYASEPIGELPIQVTTIGTDTDGEMYVVTDLPGQLHALSFEGAPGNGGPSGDCAVEYTTNDWTGGFTASVRVTNTGDSEIDGWELAFDFPAGQRLTNGWNAEWTQDGATVRAGNLPWNARIAPGDSVEAGFNGSWTGDNPPPTAFTLNGAGCDAA